MTPRQRDRRSVSRSKSEDYFKVGENFYRGAEMAKEFEYWDAAGVLMIHAAIAYTDSVTIRIGGVKNSGEDHMGAMDLLREVVVLDETGNKAVKHLGRMIEQKNLVSYGGEIYTREDVEMLWKHLERYRAWASLMLKG